MALTGIEGVTPHMLRRSVATAIHHQASVDLAAELLGHTDPKITIQHYIRRSELVNPVTADLLERAFPRAGSPTWADLPRCRRISATGATCDYAVQSIRLNRRDLRLRLPGPSPTALPNRHHRGDLRRLPS